MRPTRERPRSDLGATGARRTLMLILGVGLILYLVGVGWGLPSRRGWAPDEIEPKTVLQGVMHGFSGGWTTRYPPLHYYLLAATYPAARQFPSPVPQLGPLLDKWDLELNYRYFLSGRLLSVLLATATIWLVYRCSRVYHDRFTSCLAAASMAWMPPLVYYAKTVNLEVPYLFWFTLSLLFFARLLRRHRLRDYLGFAAAAACAVGTKDQAYALYVLPVLMMPPLLWSHRRRREARAGGPLAVLLDGRLLGSAVVGIGLFLAIHKLPFDVEGVRHHIAEMQRVAMPAAEFHNTLVGQLRLALSSLRLTAFDLGSPLLVAAVAGIAFSLRDLHRQWRMLVLLVFPLSYYLFFVAVIRYSYDRFFLPVAVVLALFSGLALTRFVRWRRLPLAAAWITLVAVFGFGLLRAVSVDAMLIADSRYAVEDWLENHLEARESALVAGRSVKLHPRGLEHLAWRDRKHDSLADWLRAKNARYLVVHPEDPWVVEEVRVEERIYLGDLNFRPGAVVFGRPAVDLLRFEGIRSNLTKINPGILIAERSSPWGNTLDETRRQALEALEAQDYERIDDVAERLTYSAIPGRRQLLGDLAVSLAGDEQQPIRRDRPAVVVVSNPGRVELSIDLRLGLKVKRPGQEVLVTVVEEETTREVLVGSGEPTIVRLGPVAAGRRRLFALLTDRGQGVVMWAPRRHRLADGVWVSGVSDDLWTLGGGPAVMTVDNPTAEPRWVEVQLTVPPGRESTMTVSADSLTDGASWDVVPRQAARAVLPPARPYGRTAIVLAAADLAAQADEPSRRGFRIGPTPSPDR